MLSGQGEQLLERRELQPTRLADSFGLSVRRPTGQRITGMAQAGLAPLVRKEMP